MKASAALAADVSLRAGPTSTAISHTAGGKTNKKKKTEAAANPTQAGVGRPDSNGSTSLVAKVKSDRGQH